MFLTNEMVLHPGTAHDYEPGEWRDALVLVKTGSIELETRSGVGRTFVAGDVLWLAGLPLRLLRNPGTYPAVLEASRRDPPLSSKIGPFQSDFSTPISNRAPSLIRPRKAPLVPTVASRLDPAIRRTV